MTVCDTPIYVIGGFFVWLLFLPILLPLFIVSSIWKSSVILVAKCVRPKLIPISFGDSFFALYSCDQQPLMSVGTTFRVQGRLETEQLMKRFCECFLTPKDESRYRNLYCHFEIFGGYVFKRRVEKLVLENHFIEKTLPRGTDAEDYISKWLVTDTYRHKPEGQPCWQVLILRRGPEFHQEETTVSIKMHHGMIDGYSFVHMVDKLTGSSSPYIVNNPERRSIFTELKHILQGPILTLDVLFRVMTTNDLVKQGNPFHTEWVLSFSTLDLDTVKDIRRKTNTKFATIMMTAATGALKRLYLEDKHHLLDTLPKQIFIESPLGLPQHPAMTKGGRFCNHFTAGIYATPLKTNDRLYRLQSLEKDSQDWNKHSGIQLMSWILFGFYWLQPACLLRRYTNHCSYLFRFSLLYSGLMTSSKKVSLLGLPVDNIYFLQATASAFPYVSLFLMCSTYDGKLNLSCYASKELVKNKQELERLVHVHLKAELAEMNKEFDKRYDQQSIVNITELSY